MKPVKPEKRQHHLFRCDRFLVKSGRALHVAFNLIIASSMSFSPLPTFDKVILLFIWTCHRFILVKHKYPGSIVDGARPPVKWGLKKTVYWSKGKHATHFLAYSGRKRRRNFHVALCPWKNTFLSFRAGTQMVLLCY